MGAIEYGICEVCLKEGPLVRTYYHYDIKCECHSPNHFELVRHHEECIPKEPAFTRIQVRTSTLNKKQ